MSQLAHRLRCIVKRRSKVQPRCSTAKQEKGPVYVMCMACYARWRVPVGPWNIFFHCDHTIKKSFELWNKPISVHPLNYMVDSSMVCKNNALHVFPSILYCECRALFCQAPRGRPHVKEMDGMRLGIIQLRRDSLLDFGAKSLQGTTLEWRWVLQCESLIFKNCCDTN